MDVFAPNFGPQPYKDKVNYLVLFNNFRNMKQFFDIQIQIGNGGPMFDAHRTVLEMRSGYFKALLRERNQIGIKVVQICDDFVDKEIFGPILDYLYNAEIVFTTKNIISILKAAHYLDLRDLHYNAELYFLSIFWATESQPETMPKTSLQNFAHISTMGKSKHRPSPPSSGTRHLVQKTLFILKQDEHWKLIMKDSPSSPWCFFDYVDAIADDNLECSDIYISGNEYIVLYNKLSFKAGVQHLKASFGVVYYCLPIQRDIYCYGTYPLMHRRYELATGHTFRARESSGSFYRYANCVYNGKIFVFEQDFLHIYDPRSNSWRRVEIPENLSQTSELNNMVSTQKELKSLIELHYPNLKASRSYIYRLAQIKDNFTTLFRIIFESNLPNQ